MKYQDQLITFICGPTASGKSRYAVDYALQLKKARFFRDVCIINADSMQIYKDLPILSALPTFDEQNLIPHHLYGYLDFDQVGTVGIWAQKASELINYNISQNILSLVVGGTGFYIKALTEGLSPIPNIPSNIRENLRNDLQKKGIASLRDQLEMYDKTLLNQLKERDTQRIMRGLEVYIHTKIPLSEWQKLPKEPLLKNPFNIIGLFPNREILYAKINARVLNMIEEGALDEVKILNEKIKNSSKSFKDVGGVFSTLGYRELLNYQNEEITLDTAIQKIQQLSRNYAKRQITWFRHQIKIDKLIEKN